MITPLMPLVDKGKESNKEGWGTTTPTPNPHANCQACSCLYIWSNVGSNSGTDYYL